MSGDRMILGALAGFSATLPMTWVMRHLHRRLPPSERYPLPPRELGETLPALGLRPSTATLLYHFLYGALAGSGLAALTARRDLGTGALFGVGVWAGSYLGWIPAAGLLRSAAGHPPRRNGLMLVAHLAWGACLAAGLRELEVARAMSFARSSSESPHLRDRPEEPR